MGAGISRATAPAEPIFKAPSTFARVFYRVRYRPWFWRGSFASDWTWKKYSLKAKGYRVIVERLT